MDWTLWTTAIPPSDLWRIEQYIALLGFCVTFGLPLSALVILWRRGRGDQ